MVEVSGDKQKGTNNLTLQQRLALEVKAFQETVTVLNLLEALAEGILVIDEMGVIVLVNRRIEELFGYKRDEVVGQPLNIFLPKRFVESHAANLDIFFKNPRYRQLGQGLDLLGRRKDGTELPIEISLSYLDVGIGRLAIAFITDITERKKTEQELRERNQELDAFAHTVAHDLNASMSLVVGYSDALAAIHESLSPEELHHYLMLIARNGRKMSNIINELLLFASMRKEDIPFQLLDMKSIIAEALRRLSYEIEAADAQIIKPESYPQVVGYAAWVEEVWFNYISNALKYGGKPPRLELGSTVREDGTLCFWVQDNGKGLTESERLAVFNSDSHAGALQVQGHGLGLSIVKRIVEKLNGRVYVESELGQGSRFGFILPASEDDGE
ncbi:MAG: PAS domain-containing sensor histidine kinase [Ardenticatenaceae bacterium]|nr:PAS domain-containing sensor histidine kinase [Ardenticatenaceae bacterium]MCB9444276.1 PAS domain-containing sensor histidine kinase [Ardenticatenaceae bacterium]